jgi:hypothetical protein
MPRASEYSANRYLSSRKASDAVRKQRAACRSNASWIRRKSLRDFVDLVLVIILAAVAWEILKAAWAAWT